MAMTSVDLDPRLIERARALTGESSNRAVLDLALRRLIASKQKGAMIDGILELAGLPDELDAPVLSYPANSAQPDQSTHSAKSPDRAQSPQSPGSAKSSQSQSPHPDPSPKSQSD